MFKKELAEVLKQTGWFLAAVFILPVPLILLKIIPGPYFAVFAPILVPCLVFWSMFLGASLFGRERGQRAMEYALSFPYPRLGLLVRLATPRLLVLFGLWLAASLALGIGDAGRTVAENAFAAGQPFGLIVLYGMLPILYVALILGFPLFVISFSLSTVIENFILLCLASLLGWFAPLGIYTRILLSINTVRFGDLPLQMIRLFPRPMMAGFGSNAPRFLLFYQSFLPAVPFLVALLVSFRWFDIRRSARFVTCYLKAFAASLVACALAIMVAFSIIASSGSKSYYLAQDLKLVEWSYGSNSIAIRGQGSILKVRSDSPYYWLGWDDGSFLFTQRTNGDLNRIDLSTGKSDPLYHFDRKQSAFWNQWNYGATVAFIENGSQPNEIQLVTLDRHTKKTDRRIYAHEAFRRGAPRLIGTDLRAGVRYWICLILGKPHKMTLRLWEDGRVEEILVKGLLETVNSPHVINGLLFFSTGPEPTIVLKDNGKSYELRKELPAGEEFQVWDDRTDRGSPDSDASPYIYGKRGARLARMDMATFEIEDIGAWGGGDDSWGYVFSRKGRFYFIGGSRNAFSQEIYDLNDGHMKLIRSFADMDSRRLDARLDIFESGIIVRKGKEIGIYAFPDLREIKY
jgi:hypothetical protein